MLASIVMDEVQQRENEEEELTLDPEREAYYKDDPKKALTKYFDREGIYIVSFCICTVVLGRYSAGGSDFRHEWSVLVMPHCTLSLFMQVQ